MELIIVNKKVGSNGTVQMTVAINQVSIPLFTNRHFLCFEQI